jgi:hypothetical protein
VINFRFWLTDTWERAVTAFIAAFAVWLAGISEIDPSAHWVEALVAACFPPVIVVLMQAVPALTYTGPEWWIDALVRIARQGVQGFLGALLAGVTLLSVDTWHAAAVAGGMAMLSALKVMAASWKTGTITPASLARPRWR